MELRVYKKEEWKARGRVERKREEEEGESEKKARSKLYNKSTINIYISEKERVSESK